MTGPVRRARRAETAPDLEACLKIQPRRNLAEFARAN